MLKKRIFAVVFVTARYVESARKDIIKYCHRMTYRRLSAAFLAGARVDLCLSVCLCKSFLVYNIFLQKL